SREHNLRPLEAGRRRRFPPPKNVVAKGHRSAAMFCIGPTMSAADPVRRSRKILLADSNSSVQRVVRQAAEQRGHVLVQATSAAATLILASETQPDLIVLDLAFTDADGRDVLRQLKTRGDTAKIPVVVWSGRNGHESDGRISLDLGA